MKKKTLLFLVLTGMLLIGVNTYSMHIMEGFLFISKVNLFLIIKKIYL